MNKLYNKKPKKQQLKYLEDAKRVAKLFVAKHLPKQAIAKAELTIYQRQALRLQSCKYTNPEANIFPCGCSMCPVCGKISHLKRSEVDFYTIQNYLEINALKEHELYAATITQKACKNNPEAIECAINNINEAFAKFKRLKDNKGMNLIKVRESSQNRNGTLFIHLHLLADKQIIAEVFSKWSSKNKVKLKDCGNIISVQAYIYYLGNLRKTRRTITQIENELIANYHKRTHSTNGKAFKAAQRLAKHQTTKGFQTDLFNGISEKTKHLIKFTKQIKEQISAVVFNFVKINVRFS